MPVFKRHQDLLQPIPQPPIRPSPAVIPTAVAAAAAADLTPSEPAPVASATPAGPGHSSAPLKRETAAVIDRNTQLTGNLHSEGNVLIEGEFEGEISAREMVLVEREACTRGKVSANDVIVSGSFDGEIVCEHRLQITSTARIKGEIRAPILVVEDGSAVDCCFKMTRTAGGR